MFDMVRTIAENAPGSNMVTTTLEHPSSFDAMSFYAQRTGKALRVAQSNPDTGGIDVDELVGLIDQDTCLLNVIYASNISGAKLDLEAIVQKVRRSEEHTSELQSLMRTSYAVFCLKKKINNESSTP